MTTGPASQHAFQAPTGTRDFYPAELARLRYIQDAWRRTSINHGFDEIDGPTFEHLDLYTVKSGEGIVSELFSFERFGGEKKFALRPEFTPTLARMYASKAASLPKPTKWFWMQNCFRAERPQRGRLREFCQWNCDILGAESNEPEALARVDAECIACCVSALEALGLRSSDVRVRVNLRPVVYSLLHLCGVPPSRHDDALSLMDEKSKIADLDFFSRAHAISPDLIGFRSMAGLIERHFDSDNDNLLAKYQVAEGVAREIDIDLRPVNMLRQAIEQAGLRKWCELDTGIVRGLAYYTGMVFEVHEASGAERAIAGGGRYDKLIEMFGGPPTPAVGFGMGDVVLSLVLQDKGLFPTDETVADKLGLRPDVFVISNGTPEADAKLAPMLASLRREGLHARRTYKTTKNVGKLLGDAVKARARFALIIESDTAGQLKDLTTQAQRPMDLAKVVEELRHRP